MLAAAVPLPSCSAVVGGESEVVSSSAASDAFPNSMPPSRAAAASLALSRMRLCAPLVSLLRVLAVPNGSRGGGGTATTTSKSSTRRKKAPVLHTRGTADAPGRPPAPLPTSPRAMALRALAALGEVAAVDEAL